MKTRVSAYSSVSALALCLALAGCQENLVRSDFISSHAGDAVAHNLAVQTIDPWPQHAYDTDIATSSQRQSDVRRKYEEKHAPQTGTLQPPVIGASKGTSASSPDQGGRPSP